jgi:hypothetical protein
MRDIFPVFEDAETHFRSFLAYTKRFQESEFGTIYTEREWRSTKPFQFGYDDIAMIVLPKFGRTNYYGKLILKQASNDG